MHELSLANSVFDLIDQECNRIKKWDLKEVEIEIGELAGVEQETFRFCLESIKKKSRFPEVTFIFIDTPAKASCFNCGEVFLAHHRFPQCPQCQSAQVGLINGLEFKVKSLIF